MNKIFKVIWNKAKNCYVVASELAKSYSKGSGSRRLRRAAVAILAVAFYAAAGSELARGDYIGLPPYNVTITEDVSGSVYGRLEDSDTSENATVSIGGDSTSITGAVYGGYSFYGKTASNSVTISGNLTSIGDSVYGGYGNNDSASNSVTISGGTVKDVYGGYSKTGDAASNSVNISNSGKVNQNVYGGYVYEGSGKADSNRVNISGGIIGEDVYTGNVYGGYVKKGTGDVSSNSVNISGGTIGYVDSATGGNVYGGYIDRGSGKVASNSVNISGNSTTINGYVFGGFSYSGDAASNSVNIKDATVNSSIYGVYVDNPLGNAIDNSVTINGGIIGGSNVYGARINTEKGNAASNSVNISDTTFSSELNYTVYGASADEGDAIFNSVSISGLTIINDNYKVDVYGGQSYSGNAESNSVNLSGGLVYDEVYGGKSGSGNAASNSVCISGNSTSVHDSVYGGYVSSGSGNAASNSVTISSGTVGLEVYGGYVKEGNGDAASNSVTISSGTVGFNVYGGYVSSGNGNAASNSVNISGGTVKDVYGGYVDEGSGDVASNSVNISGGTVKQNVYGGYIGGSQGGVVGNSVSISGNSTTINGDVYGGWSRYENVASNSVNISGGTVGGNVYGAHIEEGPGIAASNSVFISGDSTLITGNVYGGKSSSNSSNNSVNISSGTVTGNVYGGSSISGYVAINIVNISGGTVNGSINGGDTNSGDVASNNVNISGGTVNGPVFGGTSTASGKVASNSVNISSGTVNKSVYGGYTYSGNVVNNSVTISGGTFKDGSNIYGGYANNRQASSIVSGNIVNLTDSVTGFEGVNIFGYYFKSNSKKQTGNELHIGGTKTFDGDGNPVVRNGTVWQGKTGKGSINNKVKTIANFETIALHSVTWNETLPALAAESFKYDNNTAFGGNVTLDITSLTFDNDSLSGTMTLLQSDETDNFNGIKLKYSDSAAAAIPDEGQIVKNETAKSSTKGIEFTYDTKHSLSLSDSNKKINYTIANGYKKAELGSMKWSDGGHTFSDNDSIYPNGLEVSIGADFNVDGSETQEDDTQLTLLDLSQTTGIIKESVDTTKRVDVQKNAASEMTFNIAREDSIKSDQNKKKVVYTVGKSKDVTNVIFNSSINWNSDTAYYSNTSFDFTNNKVIDASKLEFKFSNDQLAELSDSSVMTLVSNASNQPEGAEVTYKNDASNLSQGVDYITDNGAVLSGSMSGVINTSDSAVKFDVSQTTLDSISLSEWDGAKEASALLEGWSANTDGVMITAASFDPNVADAEKTILTASTNVFKDENIDETIRYKNDSINNNLENGVKISGFQTGGVKATDEGKALTYFAMEKTINKFDLADWDGENDTKVPSTWKIADGASVETDGMKNLPESDSEKQILILRSDKEGFFANVALNGENLYGKKLNKFTDSDEAERVVLTGTQERGVAFDSAKTNLVYKFGSKDVTSLKLNTIAWEDGAEILSRDKYNYSKLTSLDTKDFNITYEKPETVEANQSMTVLKANETLADMAAIDKSVSYQYEPLSGVTMDAVIRSSLEAKSGKVTLTAVSNKADKLTFGDMEWLDKGALIEHKTLLNNVSFDGADVDTTKIAFSNKQKLDADMQMTLVSDFGDSVGTITGSKYKVGTAYEGEGSAYLEGSDLVFKTKTGAGLSDETHTTVMAMEAGIAMLTASTEQVGTALEGLGSAANVAPDGTATFASVGGGSSRYETGSHVDTNSWNIAVAVGKNLEKRDGTLEYGLFGEYGRGNYTLHMNGVEDAGSGSTHYSGGGLLLKWTNSHDVYTEASFRMGSMKDNASSLLHDGNGNAYGYDTSAKYRGGHFGIGKICREEGGTKLEIYGKYFYNQREGINFAAGADQYSLDEVRSRVMRAGFRYSTTQRKWNRYGGLAFDHEFGGESRGTVNGVAIRSASVKGGTLRGEFGYCREATKTNPWKTDISLYGFTGKRNGFGGSVAVEYQF